MNTADILAPIKLGSIWEQTTIDRATKKVLTRVVEVVQVPTLSRPARVVIIRNDQHKHRVGKTTAIRGSLLRANYEVK